MRIHKNWFLTCLPLLLFVTACNNDTAETHAEKNNAVYKESTITYTADGANLKATLVYDESNKEKRPAVIVVPEWWGFTEYPLMRARKLAALGYVAMAIDMYGDGKIADNPDSAKAYAGPFYGDPAKAKARVDAAIAQLRNNPLVDTANIGAVGYCFGGGVLLNTVRLGDDLKAVVSFHGSLLGTPLNKDLLRSRILVCHGAADEFVPATEVAQFMHQMDSIKADYEFKSYPDATHAFTNPDATAAGEKFGMPIRYNAAADSASWEDMKRFFKASFGR